MDVAVKGTALVILAAALAILLRRDSAATRHLIWLLVRCRQYCPSGECCQRGRLFHQESLQSLQFCLRFPSRQSIPLL
jgi:hypothetical protein